MGITDQCCACVLTGGRGTRLRSQFPDLPKGLAPVLGRPFLTIVLDALEKTGFKRVVLCTGYLGEMIADRLGMRHGALELTYSREHAPMGTGGALRRAMPYMNAETVMVVNGDTYVDTDLGAFIKAFETFGCDAAVMLVPIEDVRRYGAVHVNARGMISQFSEKGGHGPGWINSGIYLFKKPIIARIPEGREISLEKEIVPSLITSGLAAFRVDAPMIDIGTAASYARADGFFRNRLS